MYITDLGGHSGCRILLYEANNNDLFVRKISSNIAYNKRLIIQADKQKKFNSISIKTPKILDEAYTDEGLFYFDMEYIQGITLAEYMKTIEIGKVRGVVDIIVNEVIASDIISNEADESAFECKILSLEEKLFYKNNSAINNALEMLKKHSWNKFIKTSCHGDLTLENIIIKDEQLYLIDFLDSFYDCWIIDIGTLMQDVQTMWAYRLQEEININTVLRLIVFRDILLDTVRERTNQDGIEIYYALLLKLIRIYQYPNDERTVDFLNNKIVSVMKIIKETF